MKTLLDKVRESVITFTKSSGILKEQGTFDIHDWLFEFFDEYEFENWPKCKDAEGYGPKEDLDLENCEVNSLTKSKMVFTAGGDWQEGLTVELKYIEKTDSFRCKVPRNDDPVDRMKEKDFCKILGLDFDPKTNKIDLTNENKKKLTTEDCIKYITDYFSDERIFEIPVYKYLKDVKDVIDPKRWIRIRKYNIEDKTYRIFSNTYCDLIVNIESTEYEILRISKSSQK